MCLYVRRRKKRRREKKEKKEGEKRNYHSSRAKARSQIYIYFRYGEG